MSWGETNRRGPERGLIAGCKAPDGQAVVTGIGGDGDQPAPCIGIERGPLVRTDGPDRAIIVHDQSRKIRRTFPTRLLKTLRRYMGARVSSAWLPFAYGSLRPRPRRPAALWLENEFGQRSRADLDPVDRASATRSEHGAIRKR